jgi:GH35 family endo-1,4-beta-xylanase
MDRRSVLSEAEREGPAIAGRIGGNRQSRRIIITVNRLIPIASIAILLSLSIHSSSAAPSNLVDYRNWVRVGSTQEIDFETVVAPGPDAQQHHIFRVSVLRATDPFYNLQIAQVISAPLPAYHRIRMQFWARAAGSNFIRAAIEQTGAPWAGYAIETVNLTPDWREYEIVGDSPGIDAGGASARLQVGKQTGTIEFADVRVEDLGLDQAFADAQAAVQPGAIAARIREYRMADLSVRVLGADGKPLRGATVDVRQTRHAFLFGCNVFGLSQTDSDPVLQQRYRDEFAALLNYATLPFYWSAFEPVQGRPDFDHLTWMARWCADHGIETKAHPLVWHETYPGWAPNDPDAAIPLLHKRVTDIITRMSPLVKYYDVVNEAAAGAAGKSPSNGESNWVVRDGNAKVVETALGWARAAGAGKHLTFTDNDYDTGDANFEMLSKMKRDHELPDVIGIQSHMHGGVWPLPKVWMVCERFAALGVPIHFTETTVLSTLTPHKVDPNGPAATDWPTTPAGEAAQADYVRRFYSVLFSHPALRAITWWDFSDRNSWMGAPSGLVRADMTPKPAYNALMQLIHHDWWTTASGQTDKSGTYKVRAFYGDYIVTVTAPGGKTVTKTVAMPEASGAKRVVVRM